MLRSKQIIKLILICSAQIACVEFKDQNQPTAVVVPHPVVDTSVVERDQLLVRWFGSELVSKQVLITSDASTSLNTEKLITLPVNIPDSFRITIDPAKSSLQLKADLGKELSVEAVAFTSETDLARAKELAVRIIKSDEKMDFEISGLKHLVSESTQITYTVHLLMTESSSKSVIRRLTLRFRQLPQVVSATVYGVRDSASSQLLACSRHQGVDLEVLKTIGAPPEQYHLVSLMEVRGHETSDLEVSVPGILQAKVTQKVEMTVVQDGITNPFCPETFSRVVTKDVSPPAEVTQVLVLPFDDQT